MVLWAIERWNKHNLITSLDDYHIKGFRLISVVVTGPYGNIHITYRWTHRRISYTVHHKISHVYIMVPNFLAMINALIILKTNHSLVIADQKKFLVGKYQTDIATKYYFYFADPIKVELRMPYQRYKCFCHFFISVVLWAIERWNKHNLITSPDDYHIKGFRLISVVVTGPYGNIHITYRWTHRRISYTVHHKISHVYIMVPNFLAMINALIILTTNQSLVIADGHLLSLFQWQNYIHIPRNRRTKIQTLQHLHLWSVEN